jgi:hypothetical protein
MILPIDILYIIGDFGGIDLKIALKLKPKRLSPYSYSHIILLKPTTNEFLTDIFSSIELKIKDVKKIIFRYWHLKNIRQIYINISEYTWKVYYIDPFYENYFSYIPLTRPIWYHEFYNKFKLKYNSIK